MNEKKKPTSKIDSEYRIEARGGLFHSRFFDSPELKDVGDFSVIGSQIQCLCVFQNFLKDPFAVIA